MIEEIQNKIQQVLSFSTNNIDELEKFRIDFIGKKGFVSHYFSEFKKVEPSKKKEYGLAINELKNVTLKKIEELKETLGTDVDKKVKDFDLTKPASMIELGSRHPISIIRDKIIDIFYKIGFNVSEGPEIEDDWHNFTALNLPMHHPARDMQDTFFIKKDPDLLLRTHTSSVQIRHMEENEPPIRTISPGRVYRNEDISARSHCFFHQIEGLYIDENVSFADLKQTLLYFTKELFGKSKIRLRPSYFPFTEPSAEVDIYWGLESETDYRITKGTGWLEIMGCGMIDPNVLDNCKIDSSKYSGFAFGMGIERIAMLLYQIEDIRILYDNDVRFINQFKDSI
ncbi:phenylalanine--tRNA ligase subunit alpha [Flavobacteriaceae bacterium]|jgi:phenylalanyl-tRNA synthetase alpha chain|nr:phenylalanine--tRNA ligase subunit alpha [Flavobacteriaceae bacterium]MBT4297785.1 phenylalanine--tRNA ligase subunit alpha [Flavobacteriaceae bacterium]MBT4960729.1 phenylalanine--tRNA ligase subunit alpha [Flavobacteriaceae bacterium]MBT5493333.1 phenylalanine--tRNA ligase subunit alpha [Flavobacteriaceae bacterium]MBT6653871.1 phenylalanine--tRNA ligase subunit alpha [Flavobacteriaceae bacterium]|tara:strand:+ start:3676 stop:4695 length:1020 start_codon:yes stop_codon:yes gene_type:complete